MSDVIIGQTEIFDDKKYAAFRRVLVDQIKPASGEPAYCCLINIAGGRPHWAFVALQDRVVYMETKSLGGAQITTLYYQDIVEMTLNRSPILSEFCIVTAAGRVDVDLPGNGGQFQPYLDRLNSLLNAAKAKRSSAVDPSVSDQFVAQLERLAALHRSGALSDDEFQAAKTRLLEG